MSKQLRYYQREANDAVEWSWEFDRRVVLKLPTGSGKTATIAKLFENMQPGRCLFIADQDELCQQPRQAIQEWTGIIPGLDKAKDKADLRAQIVVASSQTLARETKKGSGDFERLFRYPRDHFDYIVVDECHRRTDADIRTCNHFDSARVCGLTATPFREDLADLTKWYAKVAYQMDILDLVEEGFAPRPQRLVLPVEIDVSQLKTKRGLDGKEYDLKSVDSTITPYYVSIAELVKDNAQGRHGIAYLPLISSSKAFAATLRTMGIRAMHIDGTSDNRVQILQAFAAGEIDWLCNADLLSTGVDIPIADCFLNLRLTHSRAWYQQARGRVMRVLPGVIDHLPEKSQAAERRQAILNSAKPNALLFDLLLQHDKLGAVHATDDFCRNQHDARQLFDKTKGIRTPQDILETSKMVQAEREAALVAALEKSAIRSAMSSPMLCDEVAALIGANYLLEYVPVQPWEKGEPTPAQVNALREKGVDTTSIKSKGHASALLNTIIERAKAGYCTIKQVKYLKQLEEREAEKTPDIESLSFEEASSLIDYTIKHRRRAVA